MRVLSQLKMIDWHYFEDETIDFETSTLITGDNGAGKSTIIDALQVIFIANLKQVKFNSSAHEKHTKRTIKTYLRGKTGTEGSREFLRNTNDFSSYLVLEIKHSLTGKSYLIGVVFDISIRTNEEEHTFFKIDEMSLQDHLFYVEKGLVRNRGEFFQYLKQKGVKYRQYKNNIDEYLSDLRQLCGGVKPSFFSLIQKGISFSPITNLRKFIYDYILEDQPVDVVTMQDYFEKFKDLESIIHETEEEINALKYIESKYAEIDKINRNIMIGTFMIKRSDWQKHEREFETLHEKIKGEERDLGRFEMKKKELENKRITLNETIESLTEKISTHNITVKEQELKQMITALERELGNINNKKENLRHNILIETKERSELLQQLQNNGAPYQLIKDVMDSSSVWHHISESGELQHFPKDYVWHHEQWKAGYDWLQEQNRKWQEKKEKWLQEKRVVQEKINELKKNQILTSDHPSMKLKQLLKGYLVDPDGAEVPVHILCEVIDVKDNTWKNAVEGYLHTQKFDLLVPQGYFDEALSLYERFKFSQHIARVGLVNTDKIVEEQRKPLPKSLAEEVTTDIDYVQAYVNRLLGALIKCRSEKELKNYRRSITTTCMVYQNHTARQIPKERYEVPYIGKEAIQVQLEQNVQELNRLDDALSNISIKINRVQKILQEVSDKRDRYAGWSNIWHEITKQGQVEEELLSKQQALMHLDKSDVIALEKEKEQRIGDRTQNDKQIDENNSAITTCKNNITHWTNGTIRLQEVVNEKMSNYKTYRDQLTQEITKICDEKWVIDIKSKHEQVIYQNYSESTRGFQTRKDKLWPPFVSLRTQFNGRFNFGGDPTNGTNDEYQQRLVFLEEASLVEYKDKARAAREKAHETFQEHFIAKLKENIERAQSNFKLLNQALKDMKFGTDQYQFRLTGKYDMLSYYRMITDPDLDLGHSLFSHSFKEKHGEVIGDLFSKIAEEQGQFSEVVSFYTDYRSYLDFELEMIDENENVTKFSKVALEKSGGETQVPFYVAILASFYHTYQMYRTTDTLRLIIFDEAFNRMDADRVEEAVRFILKMGFQAIIVAPTGKIQLIAPHLPNTLIVMKEDFVSYTERFTRYDLAEWIGEGVDNH